MHELLSCGLLHSDIHGSIHACWSPWLFAAYHVLLRLLMPRHSPCALLSLTIWIMFSSSLKWFYSIIAYCSFLLPDLQFSLFVVFLICITFFFIQFSSYFLQPLLDCLVGTSGLEPPTSRLSGVRSNHLSYAPIIRLRRKTAKVWLSSIPSLYCFAIPSNFVMPEILLSSFASDCSFLSRLDFLRLFSLSSSLWWRWGGSNSWPPACKAGALPAELHPQVLGTRVPFSYALFKVTLLGTFKIE